VLTEREQAILDFERTWWTADGVKESMIAEQLGIEGTEYYRVLNELLERSEALAYDPLVVRRLRRLRERRRRDRLAHAAGSDA
jgi:hypothetical protein